MVISDYTPKRAKRLSKFKIGEITEPFNIKIQWIQSISMEKKSKVVGAKMHRHFCFECHFVLEGEIAYEDEYGRNHIAQSGEGVIFAPESPHKVLTASEDLIKTTISFLPDKKCFLYRELCNLKAFKFVMDDAVCCNLNGIFLETDRNSVLSPIILKNKVFDIICSVARFAEISEKEYFQQLSDESLKVSIAKQYIEDNKNVFLTCQDVAVQCHFNTKYLNRIFKKETGMTLLTYIHKTKTEEAERLLAETDYSLEKISHMLGFANEYYFNSFFKRCNGMSPGLFREQSNNA